MNTYGARPEVIAIPVELDAEAPAPVIPGMVEPLAAMHAQGAERLTDAEQL